MFGKVPRVPKQATELKNASKDIIKRRRVSKEEFVRRLEVCRDCEYLLKAVNVCRQCGCFTKVKAALPSGDCPLGRWSLGESSVDAPKNE